MNDSYSLNYSAPVTLGLFKNHMKSMTKSDANYAFSRILVPLNRHGVIYFMDDHSLNVYTAQINVQAIGKMSSLITRRDIKMVRVEYRLFNGHITKYFLQPIEVPKSSYLINRENTGLFVTRLIGSNENSSVTTREQKNKQSTLMMPGSEWSSKIITATFLIRTMQKKLPKQDIAAFMTV